MNDVDVDLLRPHRRAARMIDRDLDKIIGTQPVTNVFVPSVYLAASCFYEFAQIHLAQTAEMIEQKILEPHLRSVIRNGNLNSLLHAENLSL
jgi:hypothetical protein